MKKFGIFIFCLLNSVLLKSQCLNADSLSTTNITYVNAQANWISAPNAHHYLIHYRELGTTNWSNLGNIDSTMTSRNIPQLQQLTTYEWQIKTFCDSTNQPNSGWSYSDTFTTTAFVPSQFNPSILPIISNTTCDQNTAFSIIAQQQQNEPDISTSVFFSDKGYFEMSNISSGDTLGNASYSSAMISFSSLLILDFKLGPNYGKIDMIDSLGDVVGFFVIENLVSGIKVTTIGPNDGNNYTSGYVSQINFIDLFVNPSDEGPIIFTADINSELGDVLQKVDSSIIISCPHTGIEKPSEKSKLIKITDILGKETKTASNKILLYIYSDGTVERKIKLK
tara:strand:+ start:8015 stop:9025 length:1011 start_codon:yes stop_codon:yes gene_type:complete